MKHEDASALQTDLREPLQRETVASIGFRDLVALEIEGASLADAIRLMQERAVGCLVVLDRGRLAGIFTERDLLARVLGKARSFDQPLADYVTRNPTTARVDEPIHLVLTRMHQGKMRHLPVVDAAGRPVGTMSVKRAAHFLADHYPEAVFNVPPDPDRFPESREGG